jgi:hypothetical protein
LVLTCPDPLPFIPAKLLFFLDQEFPQADSTAVYAVKIGAHVSASSPCFFKA